MDAPITATSMASSSRRSARWLPFYLIEPATLLGDLFVITAACILSDFAYQSIFLDGTGKLDTSLGIAVLVFANFIALTSAQQNYRPTNLVNIGRQLRYVTLNWLFILFVLVTVAFSLKIGTDFSRGSTLSFLITGWTSLIAFRAVLAGYLKRALAEGAFAEQNVVLIAEQGRQNASRALAELRQCGYRPIDIIELVPSEISAAGITKSLKQKLQTLISDSPSKKVNYIFLVLKWEKPQLINAIVRMLRVLPIPVHLLPDENVAAFLAARSGNLGRTLTVELQRAPLSEFERMFKRLFDVFIAIAMIILLLPVMVITALLIKLDSRGPIFFRQKRNGFNGNEFAIYKFRTMHVLEDGNHIQQARPNDPRVTRLGHWLRSTSIDELPQLFNVLLGDMSIVGPRPHAVAHNNEYQTLVANYAFRHHVKPGITGWAQVNGFRGQTQTVDLMAKRIDYDLWYINHWSLWLDLRILFKTLLSVYSQPMAY
jgi:Undecaprenyl-phosphate glucose phosphotransferase